MVSGAVSIGYAGIHKKNGNIINAPNEIPVKPEDDMSFHPVIPDPKSPTWIAILWAFITPCFVLC